MENDLQARMRLWQEAFGDTEEEMNRFFTTAYDPRRSRVLWQENQLAAALYWLDCRWNGRKIAYLYAVSTAKAFRGRGLCHALMGETLTVLREQGYAGAVLVPAEESLFAFYADMGFFTCSSVSEFTEKAGKTPVPVQTLNTEEYALRRRMLLPENSVLQEEENLRYLKETAELYGGDGFLLAASREGETLNAAEYLGDVSRIPGILRTLGCAEGNFRTPGTEKEFAMYCSFENSAGPSYFGLCFD